MIYEFEGRTEKEAIDNAVKELSLTRDSFDVEIIETQKGGLFKKGFVKIQVHTDDAKGKMSTQSSHSNEYKAAKRQRKETKNSSAAATPTLEAEGEIEPSLIDYAEKIICLMGYTAKVGVQFRDEKKLGLKIESKDSAVLIGRKGKTLDALQLLLTIRAGRLGDDNLRVILDCENYRVFREESLVRLAYSVADKVRDSKRSMLLEPMNPFDRRLIHTTLNDMDDIGTKSEGDGMYKQVRVFLKK
ncbi:MAG: protein jag [Termitinemataceae bacterium]|nr:MAG: protein jag [Termitinemataceae bacterium]